MSNSGTGGMAYRPDGTAQPLAWRWILLESAFLFAACAFVFHSVLGGLEGPLESDTLWHFKTARLILERGPWVSTDNLPFTVLGTHGTDHYWFVHFLQAPFTLLGHDLRGIHLAAALFGGLVPAVFNPMLRRNLVPYAPLVCLLMISATELFPYRLLSLRGQNFALPMMVAMMFAMLGKRRWLAGVGAFFFMQGYHAAVILAMFSVMMLAVNWVHDRTIELRTVIWVAAGGSLGLILSPWFPDNVRYLTFHTLFKVAQAEQGIGLVGTEWFIPSWKHIVNEGWPAHIIFLGSLAAAAVLYKRMGLGLSRAAMMSSAATLVFLMMERYMGWRFGEYYAPFAIMSAALIWRDALALAPSGPARTKLLAVPAVALIALMAWTFNRGLQDVHGIDPAPERKYKAMMEYVDAHDPKPMVFNNRWWDFPTLFYHSKKASFVAGMDGHFLMYGDPARFRFWYSVIRGREHYNPKLASTIHDGFGARWVVIARREFPIAQALMNDRNARVILATEDGWLFETRAEGAAWPAK